MRWFRVLMTLSVTFTLWGCAWAQQGASGPAAVASPAPATQAAKPGSTAPRPAAAPSSRLPSSPSSPYRYPITVWYSLPTRAAGVLQGFLQQYQSRHRYVQITGRNFSEPGKLYDALTSPGKKPTLALMEASWLPEIKARGALMRVEDWMPRTQFAMSWSIKDNVFPDLFKASSVDGQLMARPFFFTTRALIYNTDLFKKAKIKAPPRTWDQLAKDSARISKLGKGMFGFRLASDDNPSAKAHNLQVFTWQAGGNLVTSAGYAPQLAGLQKAVAFLTTVARKEPDPDSPFVAGQVGMCPGTVADFLRLRQQGLPVKVAALPGPDASTRISSMQIWSLGMFGVPSDQLYNVQPLAFWLLGYQQQLRWAEQTSYLAAHVKVFNNPFYRRTYLPEYKSLRVFLDVLHRCRLVDTAGQAEATFDSLGRQVPALLRGSKKVSDLAARP